MCFHGPDDVLLFRLCKASWNMMITNSVAGLRPRGEMCEVCLSFGQHEQLCDSKGQQPPVELHNDRGTNYTAVHICQVNDSVDSKF